MPAVFYQGVGDRLTQWDVDVEAATLTPRGSITLPSKVQYAWPHPSARFLYVTTSDAASGNTPNPGTVHRLCALSIGPAGELAMHGEPAVLPQRPIHHSLDRTGRYALTCYNTPSNLTVHHINDDGTVGAAIPQPANLDLGIYAHQFVALPHNRSALMVARGNRPEGSKTEDPGALKIYGFDEGRLSPLANLPVGGKGGYGYGPRHVDFHPSKPWMYVSVESQSDIHMHRLEGDSVTPEPLYKATTTIGTYDIHAGQITGGIHVHPDGRAVYVSNRADLKTDVNGRKVFAGGENSIAVFAIDPGTGEPRLIQHADPKSCHVRTFSFDPTGKLFVAASIEGRDVLEDGDVRHVPAALSVFRVADDGRLTFVRKYDVETGDGSYQWWTGFVGLA
ncbi:MAG: lactonase family protein [Hyphomicrobiaceae bacterium]